MPNRLIYESSPYLLQHANNPVDWYPWGSEALECSKSSNKPIFLSIGYMACHWCHVMEKECFENVEISDYMNNHFVNIKVDREERPDLDSIYMQAVQVLTGRGGWPMSVFLTPGLIHFYGGTYFPPDDLRGMPGFKRVLEAISDAYRDRIDDVTRVSEQLREQLLRNTELFGRSDRLDGEILKTSVHNLTPQFDTVYGGFGNAPKFPQPMTQEFLLRYGFSTKDNQVLKMVDLTLDQMANGGIYDHLGGGFHRYSTDAAWFLPHFEKMLYDNALLARLYTHGFQARGFSRYQRVAEETLDYLIRDMRDANGGFYTAQDADSQDGEGVFYLWSKSEIVSLLGKHAGDLVSTYFGVTDQGNFEGENILTIPRPLTKLAEDHQCSEKEFENIVAQGRAAMHAARRTRMWPSRDEKILTSWNGLTLSSLAEASAVFQRPDYLKVAKETAEFLVTALRPNGRLHRSFKDGKPNLIAYLEDYALLIDGLICLYEACFEEKWLLMADVLAREMIGFFWDINLNTFYDTAWDHEELIVRPRDLFDNAMPCGSSAAVIALARLSILSGKTEYHDVASQALCSVQGIVDKQPLGFGNWLCGLDFLISKKKEIVLVGPRDDGRMAELIDVVHSQFLPNKVICGKVGEDEVTGLNIPLLQYKVAIEGRPTAYVCEEYICQNPVTDPKDLVLELGI